MNTITVKDFISIKLIVFCVFLLLKVNVYGQQQLLNKKISIRLSDSSLLQALDLMSTEYSVPLSYDPELIPGEHKVDRAFVNVSIAEILKAVLAGTGLTYKILHNEIIIIPIDKVSLSGRIVDAESGEDLIGASLYIPELKQGVISNGYGFYSLTVPPGRYEIQVSLVGYTTLKTTCSLVSNENKVFQLQRKVLELQEIQVRQPDEKDSSAFLSPGKTFNWANGRQRAYFKGESDLIKALQMENGITALTEGSSYMFIRGGNKDQNLIILDEATVYGPSHLFGLTSVFNPDALKNIQTFTGAMPANFGGRLSSVIDVRTADGDDKQLRLKGGVSLLTARASLEGPIVKDKSSFLFAARRSLNNLLSHDLELFDLRPAYYDLNFKLNYKLSQNNRVFASAYVGRDRVNSSNGYLNKWGNQTATLRWNHIFGPKHFVNLSAIYSNYKNILSINADSSQGTNRWITGIRDVTLKGDFINYPNPHHQFLYGFSSIYHLFIPGESSSSVYNNISRVRANEHALYFSHKLSPWKKIKLNYGLRMSYFNTISNERTYDLDEQFEPVIVDAANKKGFLRWEPRLSLQYMPGANGSLLLSYNRNYQYLQLVQNDELAFSSLESWIPSGINLLPQRSDFISLSYKDILFGGSYIFDVYYKKMQHQLELTDHAQLISNSFIEGELRPGFSNAYGIEFSFSKNIGNFKGNLMYAFSKVYRTINGINEGRRYPAGYNIPHVLKLNLSYQISRNFSANSFFTYSTGRPLTSPIGYYEQNGLKVPIYGDRNSSKMPDYHRLDLTIQWTPAPIAVRNRNWFNTFSVGLFNVYNHRSPLFYRINQQDLQELNFDQQSFSGRTLGLSYTFKF
ncbi:TonB-dependent receptor [Pedobacter suwonensis]|uniref:TonB-dependent receptor n=1 Tax=Pedobacter suwonensis TaxID=332999 RepID=UPI0011A399D4|nr:TonB-dependent receptor [Pedobacter suwonensis]